LELVIVKFELWILGLRVINKVLNFPHFWELFRWYTLLETINCLIK